ncbi:hypothetical protein [Nonomuraea basaltis]|uniref:hypothetical protein n=1 Tax=Nonomuraea basaltis TaxID=2495887 RepID=UPI001980664E|nr:hypothetical protein [Nonomuraea basaltis]
MALGLGVLVAAAAHTGPLDGALGGAAAVTAHVSAALTGSTVLLTMALLVVVIVIVPARRTPSTMPVNPINDTTREEVTT